MLTPMLWQAVCQEEKRCYQFEIVNFLRQPCQFVRCSLDSFCPHLYPFVRANNPNRRLLHHL